MKFKIKHLGFYLKYISHFIRFKELNGKITHIHPIILDFTAQAGTASGVYFHQDLLVASLIYAATPERHIDIGSRIDGFVAHLATFRKIEVMDVRELKETGHQNIIFLKADLMDASQASEGITDSISCLHAIEHFGLGRYGDPLDPLGHIKGFNNMLKMLKPNGTFYISFPIGRGNEVHFNAHRVFHPQDIFNWIGDGGTFELVRFDFVDDQGNLHQKIDLKTHHIDVKEGCGIYTLKKLSV